MLCPLLGGRCRCEGSYRYSWDSFPQRGLLSSGDRLWFFFSFVFAGRRVQVQAGQLGLQRRGQTTHAIRTLTFDPWQPADQFKLTGVMICERGRRSVTRGRDTVGWLSFSVDKTTTSRSTSANDRHNLKKKKKIKTLAGSVSLDRDREEWSERAASQWSHTSSFHHMRNSPPSCDLSRAESDVKEPASDLGLSHLGR